MADVNGQQFWLLSDERDWVPASTGGGLPTPRYCVRRRSFTLGSYARVRFTETPAEADTRWALPRVALDAYGMFAYFNATSGAIEGAGTGTGSVPIHTPVAAPTDMLVSDGILYVLEGNEVVLVDLRDRWDPVRVSAPNFEPARIAAGASAVWVLDRANRLLAKVVGSPLRRRSFHTHAGDVFRPDDENADPVRLVTRPLAVGSEVPVDIAASAAGRLAILCWRGASETVLRVISENGTANAGQLLAEVQRPFALAWLDEESIVVLVAALRLDSSGSPVVGSSQVVAYNTDASSNEVVRAPLGHVYPLPDHDGGPFARGPLSPPRYPISASPLGPRAPRKLVPVSSAAFAASGELIGNAPLDSGRVGCVWHRAYLEANLAVSSGIRLLVGVSDRSDEPPTDYFEHVVGDVQSSAGAPRAVWSPLASELPFYPGVLAQAQVPHRSGLFSVLLQRTGRRVSSLVGRYLWVRLVLEGNGHGTPEIAALRIYASRFSYAEQYLPRVFHESLMPPEADAPISVAARSAADFLERFLCNFEGVLTPLEDRIANAHLLTDPSTVPAEALDWLGSWIGFVFDPAYPNQYRREALSSAMELNRWRGTLRGMSLSIDVLTGGRVTSGKSLGGAVSGGQVVILEGWRMRRTFATILGVDLSNEFDPLLVGITRSGNSRVGDSLILTEPLRREFLALLDDLSPDAGRSLGADAATARLARFDDPDFVQSFFDRLAYHLVILVHEDLGGDTLSLIEKVVAREAPAHLETQVSRASYPFMVGFASLVGVDTYLRPPPPKAPVLIDQSLLGTTGFLSRPASLDPRLQGES